ncbi:hypothetical protein ERJ75_000341000 [Trypanosoma vivax]|uniref:Uncharacterized protein n=1 Tax=Trypanosoma vivax (strain Y486) TaxID=1055687 RepID=F9WVD9_TRYVY|nr:hypothetical protein ERJ75_000341000 [Trypanosoma vivax]CCD21546.1 hypothetical protein, conserved in T. vivax [Trypanosoma vivax Y486]|eukprot:CCD21546.1 hypothetical protein, conserved in T. vivax [Trypanosoma vivax Y486]
MIVGDACWQLRLAQRRCAVGVGRQDCTRARSLRASDGEQRRVLPLFTMTDVRGSTWQGRRTVHHPPSAAGTSGSGATRNVQARATVWRHAPKAVCATRQHGTCCVFLQEGNLRKRGSEERLTGSAGKGRGDAALRPRQGRGQGEGERSRRTHKGGAWGHPPGATRARKSNRAEASKDDSG